MTLITVEDNKIVMHDGKVGTEQECCCGGNVCVCPACDTAVVEFSISGNPGIENRFCFGGPYITTVEAFDVAIGDPSNTHGGIYGELTCEVDEEKTTKIKWVARVESTYGSFDADPEGQFCTVIYEGEAEADPLTCQPVEGAVEMVEVNRIDDGKGVCGQVPAVSVFIDRLDLP